MLRWNRPDIETTEYFAPISSSRMKFPVSDDIYTLDIETTSLFYLDNKWQCFDYSRPPEDYKEIPKASVPYIWQFSINEKVYYGREFYELEDVFNDIYEKHFYKIIYIFNLSFEMQFLMNILSDKYTIKNMVCRDIRKPIQFEVPELHMIFRCAYMLTNMSLEVASLQYTDVEKKKGDLDYNKARSPLTHLSEDKEMGYCEYDCICLYKIILYFKNKYKHLYKIPLTSTSIVRKELKKKIDYWYMKKQWSLVPPRDIYLKLMSCFAGGYCHANALNAYKVHHNVHSQDEASAYPSIMVTEKLPCKEFLKCSPDDFTEKKRERYAFMLKVHFENVKPKYYNHYMQISKCIKPKKLVNDNGRIVSIESCDYWLTDVDFDLILKCYKCDYEILEIYKAKKDYLDIKVIKYILELYGGKTKLKKKAKTDPEVAEVYQMMKGQLNSLYGVSVTNILSASTDFINGKWIQQDLTKSFVDKKLDDYKHSWSNLFYYACGCWITALGRRNIFEQLLKIDVDLCYTDTDSLKYLGDHQDIFDEYNEKMIDKYKAVIKKYPELTLDDFMPEDEDGIRRPIGFYEYEGCYDSFVTCGAKKYAYEEDGELHITISGVNKKTGISALEGDISKFTETLVFDYNQSGRLVHYYIDDQPEVTFTDIDGNIYTSNYKYGIVLQPTTYTLGGTKATDVYIQLVKMYERRLAVENGKQEDTIYQTVGDQEAPETM